MDSLTPSDDELEQVFTPLGFDGVWSKLTRLLLIAFKTPRGHLFLDRNWALSPQGYTCVICQRNKVELIDHKQGWLRAMLHCDHDHIVDVIVELAKKLDVVHVPQQMIHKYASYQPTIICRSCNWIDSQLKHKFDDIHSQFSFPTHMKQRLILQKGRRRHKIDFDGAWDYWSEQKDDFLRNLEDIHTQLLDLREVDHKAAPKKYQPRKLLFETAFKTFQECGYTHQCHLDFHSFLKRSVSWPEQKEPS